MRDHRIFLLSCVKSKAPHAMPARDLYVSDWFRKARAYTEAQASPWFILSAEHGLLHPDQVIAPYDRTLLRMTSAERTAWGRRVGAQLDAITPTPTAVVFLAGKLYRDPLRDWTRERGTAPMANLGIGRQKAWLSAQLRAPITPRA